MNEAGLKSLENFPELKELLIVRILFLIKFILNFLYLYIQLELNNNKLTGDDLQILVKQCPKLYKLKIKDNEINSIDNFKCLSELKELKKINVKGNPFCDTNANFEDKLFQMLNTLESVDSHNKEGGEVESSIYIDEEEEEDDDENGGSKGKEQEDDEEEVDEDEDEGEEFNDDDDDADEDDDEDEDDDDDEEVEKPKKKSKK